MQFLKNVKQMFIRVPRTMLYGFTCSKRSTSYIPKAPTWSAIGDSQLPQFTKIDTETVEHLERQALVDFTNEEAIERLQKAIRFADQLSLVDTTDVEPMDTVLENYPLFLREDVVTMDNTREDVMRNAVVTEDDYFIAPPGNIPLEKTKKH